jgi:hypothetical protein
MCGRYYRRSDKQRIAEAFKLGRLPEGFELPPDWNIAPSTNQPIIRSDPETGEREMVLMRWGLVPAKIADPDSFKIFTTTNARAEGPRQADLERPVHTLPVPDSPRRILRVAATSKSAATSADRAGRTWTVR